MALVLAGLTVVAAPFLAAFFREPQLESVLLLLAAALPLKALAIVPRAVLSRDLHFRGIGAADIVAAAAGAVGGISAAALGAGYFAVVPQVLVTDLLTAAILLVAARGPAPNLYLSEVRPLLAFSASVFATNWLAYFSRNTDNILVGRVLGVTSLSFYSMAYRIMVIPVQLIGQTVNRVMFPAISRAAGDRTVVAGHLAATTRPLSMAVIPMMALVACVAHDLVLLVLGEAWLPAAPLMAVLAIGGARETIFYITPPLMKGMGRAGLNLRCELLAFALQVSGIVVGLQFGLLGVAVGLVASGFLLTPVLLGIQKRLCGIGVRTQFGQHLAAVARQPVGERGACGAAGHPRRSACGGAAAGFGMRGVPAGAGRRAGAGPPPSDARIPDLGTGAGRPRGEGHHRRHVRTGASATEPFAPEPSLTAGALVPTDTDGPESPRAARSLP